MQNHILYHAAGSLDRINDCRYALLKYLGLYNLKPPANTRVMVATDQPELFESYIPFFEHFVLQEPTAPDPRASRLLAETLPVYPGNLLYCLPGTYPAKPLEPLFRAIQNGQFVLYAPESSPEAVAPLKALLGRPLRIRNQEILLSHTLKLWDLSAIGINSNDHELMQNISLFSESLHLPPAAADQVAFSHFAAHRTALSARNYFARHQTLKEFRSLLNLFFKKNEEESIPNLVKLIAHVNAAEIEQDKTRYERMPFYKKLANRILGRGWSIDQYIKKI